MIDTEELLKLEAEGLSHTQIAEKLGLERSTISKTLKKAHISLGMEDFKLFDSHHPLNYFTFPQSKPLSMLNELGTQGYEGIVMWQHTFDYSKTECAFFILRRTPYVHEYTVLNSGIGQKMLSTLEGHRNDLFKKFEKLFAENWELVSSGKNQKGLLIFIFKRRKGLVRNYQAPQPQPEPVKTEPKPKPPVRPEDQINPHLWIPPRLGDETPDPSPITGHGLNY